MHGSTLFEGLNEMEFEFVVEFARHLRDWNPASDPISKYRSEEIVSALMTCYHKFDETDDGVVEFVNNG